MNKEQQEQLRQELLEYIYGCHENEGALEARLEADEDLRTLLAEVRETANLLDRAARERAPELSLTPPAAEGATENNVRKAWYLHFKPQSVWARVAASILIIPAVLWGWTGVSELRLGNAESKSWSFMAKGPASLPDGAAASFHLTASNLRGGGMDCELRWSTYDEQDVLIAKGTSELQGELDLELPPQLRTLRRVHFVCANGTEEQVLELQLAPQAAAPLVHLTSDKPAYQPGEMAYLRAVLLDRIGFKEREGWMRLRITDPKGASIEQKNGNLERGVLAFSWQVPADAAGGEYMLELRDSRDQLTVESLPLLVRRFQTPRLAKTIDLDRESYAAGAEGAAEIHVERVEGGPAAGAVCKAFLIIDEEEVWSEEVVLDAQGRAILRFKVPLNVERGDARFLARITDGGQVETAIEPFLVPTGALNVHLYPEGGGLVAGVKNRVYAEVFDALGRPASASGRVVDKAGEEIALFETLHQGRGFFEITPASDASYSLVLEDERTAPISLPASSGRVALHATDTGYGAGADLGLSLTALDEGPWHIAAFCRGVLVAQAVVRGAGEHAIALEIPAAIGGVLRVTVFDGDAHPVAERLVQRAPSQRIQIAVEAVLQSALPGDHQRLRLRATDENGAPVHAVLGLAVSDRAVRDMLGDVRIGLADQTWLTGDLRQLEQVRDFIGTDAESLRNVDLLLGTRGWRRFAWVRPSEAIADHGDDARRLVALEGHSRQPQSSSTPNHWSRLHPFRTAKRKAIDASAIASFLALILICLSGYVRSAWRLYHGKRPTLVGGSAIALTMIGWSLLVTAATQTMSLGRGDMMRTGAAFGMAVPQSALEDREFDFVTAAGVWGEDSRLDGLGYADVSEEAPTEAPVTVLNEDSGADGQPVPDTEPMVSSEPSLSEATLQDFREFSTGNDDFYRPNEAQVRIYAHKRKGPRDIRSDFTQTVYWNGLLVTDKQGRAEVEFDLSDRITTWNISIDAHGGGRVGQALDSFQALAPLYLEAKLPIELTQGDSILVPVAFNARDEELRRARFSAAVSGPLATTLAAETQVDLELGKGHYLLPIEVQSGAETARIALAGQAGGYTDRVVHDLRVVPRGFPHAIARSGQLVSSHEIVFNLPEVFLADSLRARIELYPSPIESLLDGLEGMLREPGGCFEQVSSSNYPNALVLNYLEAIGSDSPAIANRARAMLQRGYPRLTAYECSKLGYEWFGHNPAHEALTAYGLLEFHDMAQAVDVDASMMERTRDWLLDTRDGKGGYELVGAGTHTFGYAPQEINDAYLTYALVSTGQPAISMELELDRLETRSIESQDPYEVAIAAAGLQAAGRLERADAARDRLKLWQEEDGSVNGTTTSITSSKGLDLRVETTALALQAWLVDDGDEAHVRRALQFLMESRRAGGTFGATQATVQALRALIAYASKERRFIEAGRFTLSVNGQVVRTVEFAEGEKNSIELEGLESFLHAGENRLSLELTGDNQFPFACEVRYHSDQPADSVDAPVAISTSLSAAQVTEGESVALQVKVTNDSAEDAQMVTAIIGLPASLEAPTAVLNDLQDAGRFDDWEVRGREVVLYWRGLHAGESKQVALDLIARIPGTTTGPASRVYPYYSPDMKSWVRGLAVVVTPARR